jgi:hypothetical protein
VRTVRVAVRFGKSLSSLSLNAAISRSTSSRTSCGLELRPVDAGFGEGIRRLEPGATLGDRLLQALHHRLRLADRRLDIVHLAAHLPRPSPLRATEFRRPAQAGGSATVSRRSREGQ